MQQCAYTFSHGNKDMFLSPFHLFSYNTLGIVSTFHKLQLQKNGYKVNLSSHDSFGEPQQIPVRGNKMFQTIVTPRQIKTTFGNTWWDVLDTFWFVPDRFVRWILLNLAFRCCCNRWFSVAALLSILWQERRFLLQLKYIKYSWKYIKIIIELPVLLELITRSSIAP